MNCSRVQAITISFWCCLIVLGMGAVALAQELGPELPAPSTEQQEIAISEAVAEAAVPQSIDPGMKIEELIEEYNATQKGSLFQHKMDLGQLYYSVERARVKVDASDPDWANYRTMAFEEAVLNAQAAYMKFLGVSVRAESLKSVQSDPSMPQFTRKELGNTNKFEEILEKAIAVVGSKLDKMLEENGINPTQFKALPKVKQKELLRNSIEKRTITTACANLTGMIVVQTFEASNTDGKHEVAVAVVASPKFKHWVGSIITNKGDLPNNPHKIGGPTVRSIVGRDKAALFQQFGIRRVYDEEGYPVLISYGQAGNPYHGNDYDERSEQRELAINMADSIAYANFAFLFNSYGTFSQNAGQKVIEKTLGKIELQGDGSSFSSKERSKKFVSTLNQNIKAKGHVSNLPGVRKLTSWTYKHPEYNQEIVGVVYVWSPKSNNVARALRKNTSTKKKKTVAPQAKTTGSAKAVIGQEMMDVDDF